MIDKLVRKGGLEPPRFYPPDPKSGASANSATFAKRWSRAGFAGLSVGYFSPDLFARRNEQEILENRLQEIVTERQFRLDGSFRAWHENDQPKLKVIQDLRYQYQRPAACRGIPPTQRIRTARWSARTVGLRGHGSNVACRDSTALRSASGKCTCR